MYVCGVASSIPQSVGAVAALFSFSGFHAHWRIDKKIEPKTKHFIHMSIGNITTLLYPLKYTEPVQLHHHFILFCSLYNVPKYQCFL